MWITGIAWSSEGYVAAAVHADGRVQGPRGFRADATGVTELVSYAKEFGDTVVIDPTNGVLADAMDGTGLRVLRSRASAGRDQDPVRMARAVHTEGPAADLTDAHQQELADARAASVPTERRLAAAGRWIARGPAGRRQVALTFDDGPTRGYTDRVLDVLRDHGVPATFFCVGLHVQALPATVARIRAEGHTVANHTWSHPSMIRLSRDDLRHQIDATGAAVAAVTGERPALLRPPYGDRSPQMLEWVAAEGMTTVLWDTDTRDWSRPGTETVAARALDGAGDGSVVLMHDGGGDRTHTVEALPRIIGGLLAQGYTLVTVDRMMGVGPA